VKNAPVCLVIVLVVGFVSGKQDNTPAWEKDLDKPDGLLTPAGEGPVKASPHTR
jgi:hypothetical protein